MAKIVLLRGQVALIYDEDAERVALRTGQRPWRLDSNGYVSRSEGSTFFGTYRTIYLHRVVMNATPDEEIDHRDRNRKFDCRKGNLRRCTHQQNLFNQKKKSNATTSRFKGVSWRSKNGKFEARIRAEGKLKFLGYFSDEVAAHEAYKQAAIYYFGEFASY
jgi:hypothetical protein